MKGWAWILGCALLAAARHPLVWADVLNLSNGREVEGIIVQETDAAVKVQVTWQGYLTIDRDAVTEIARGDALRHEQLLARWQIETDDAKRGEEARRQFDAEQRARGLVKYGGRWVHPRTLQRAAARRREHRELQARVRRLNQRLGAVEEENRRLRRDVTTARMQPRLLGPFVVRHERRPPRPQPPGLLVDEHGNFLRVRRHDDHPFVMATDGTHLDAEPHGDHLAFTDARGRHRDLQQVPAVLAEAWRMRR